MSNEQKSFLLRLPKPLLEAYQKWAEDELRSLNGQLEYVLRQVLREQGRLPKEQMSEKEKVKTVRAK